MSVIKTDIYRKSMAQYMFSRLTNAEIAIGSGGHNQDNTPIPPVPSQTSLAQEVKRMPCRVNLVDEYTVEVAALFPLRELAPYTEISEIGLFVGDDLLAVRNAAPTVVDPRTRLDGFSATIIFPY